MEAKAAPSLAIQEFAQEAEFTYRGIYRQRRLFPLIDAVQESCYVYGIVDEYGILQEDEVFVNIPGRAGVVLGDVIVARYVFSFT